VYSRIERWEPWLLPYIPESGDVAIDVGANVGAFSIDLAATFRRVLAFEPGPLALRELLADVPENVDVYNMACGSTPGFRLLHLHPKTIHTSIWPAAGPDWGQPVGKMYVYTVPLDKVLIDGQLDFLKIDVEGAEYDVLVGAGGLLNGLAQILVEIHNRENAERCQRLLRAYGYEANIIRHPNYKEDDPAYETHLWLEAHR